MNFLKTVKKIISKNSVRTLVSQFFLTIISTILNTVLSQMEDDIDRKMKKKLKLIRIVEHMELAKLPVET